MTKLQQKVAQYKSNKELTEAIIGNIAILLFMGVMILLMIAYQ